MANRKQNVIIMSKYQNCNKYENRIKYGDNFQLWVQFISFTYKYYIMTFVLLSIIKNSRFLK